MDTDLNKTVSLMEQWARLAGEIQLKHFRSRALDIHSKQNDFDVVTVADRESERMLIDNIRRTFPDHSILSEESGQDDTRSDWRWIIDPLDGTTNYSNGLPVFSVSIALEYRGEVVAGVVYAPYLDELFSATAGGGATLNGTPIHCGTKTRLQEAVLTTGMPYDRAENPVNNLDNICRVVNLVRGTRRYGSAALDLCYVGAGFFDGYFEMDLNLWDIAAGRLVAREAGARVESFRDDRKNSVLAASPAIFDLLRPIIR